jgi:DNA-binding response OmpR family regulator
VPAGKILIAEDDGSILTALVNILSHDGHSVTGVQTGEAALSAYRKDSFDLVILDLMLPGISGLEVCDRIRVLHPQQRILMLTARNDEADVVEGLRRGADDYVTKPFRVVELRARVAALLRRSSSGSPRRSVTPFRFGPWLIEPVDLRATAGDSAVRLSDRELELISLLAQHDGQVVSRETILAQIWSVPEPDKLTTRRVDMLVAKLRHKLHATGGALIETVFGAGYRYESRRSTLEIVNSD